MKLILALVLAALPVATLAQTAETPAASAVSLDTPIEQLLANEKTKAVLDARIPGLTSHPMLDQFKAMSLKQLLPMAGGQLTDAMLEAVAADLASGK
ncbi:MAG: hypothetical protein B7Y82_13680 [Sphingomonadales bacterium 32-65-25]|nr:MAG: hypothetical protein B7Z50_01945 [Sphingomonadales bacterium 12-62-5]OYX76255.1 MAG: hypothetical protein B7Y82_13680 [Sphingomonadales bacterium 32-65-25]